MAYVRATQARIARRLILADPEAAAANGDRLRDEIALTEVWIVGARAVVGRRG